MDLAPLPATAAWRHRDARAGFEVAYFQGLDRGCRIEGRAAAQSYDYAAPVFDFTCRIAYDESGLVLNYPGIAVRAG
ncbi:MAG: hypothetical protein ACRDN1_16370 [Trebonia sp.]